LWPCEKFIRVKGYQFFGFSLEVIREWRRIVSGESKRIGRHERIGSLPLQTHSESIASPFEEDDRRGKFHQAGHCGGDIVQ